MNVGAQRPHTDLFGNKNVRSKKNKFRVSPSNSAIGRTSVSPIGGRLQLAARKNQDRTASSSQQSRGIPFPNLKNCRAWFLWKGNVFCSLRPHHGK